MANSYLSRTPSSAGNRQKWTWSAWVKFSQTPGAAGATLFSAYAHGNDNFNINLGDTNQISMRFYNGTEYQLVPNRRFRDFSAWYHLVFAVDTTLATAADRFKIYVNGVRETSFSNEDQPTQNLQMTINDTTTMQIGRYSTGSNFFDGYMSHVSLVDGQALTPTSFGETDSTSGIWKFKSPSGLSWGTNGVHLKFENSGNLGLDSSGQTNNFTVNGNLKQALDTPSNVYATLNALQRIDDYNFSNGNNTFTNTSAGAHRCVHSTLSASSGKWYAEVKVVEVGGTYPQIGVINPDVITFTDYLGGSNKGYGYLSDGRKQINTSATSYGNTYTTGDIIGIAMDLDNHKLYFSKNGTFQNSGVPTSGSTGTGAIDLATGVFYSFGQSSYKDGSNPVYSWNFGNGYFGTTAVSSAGTNASGIGIFEYDVPTGYTALSTKGLNE